MEKSRDAKINREKNPLNVKVVVSENRIIF